MLNRIGGLWWVFAMSFLMACQTTTQSGNIARTYNVVDIQVILDEQPKGSISRNGLTNAGTVSTMRAEISEEVSGVRTGSEATPVKLVVEPINFYIANPALGILVGGSTSSVRAHVTLKHANTGQVIARDLEIAGVSGRRSTLVGVAFIKSPAEEVRLFSENLGMGIHKALFVNTKQLDQAIYDEAHPEEAAQRVAEEEKARLLACKASNTGYVDLQ